MHANAKLEARMDQLGFSQAWLARGINLAVERLTGSPGSVTDSDVRRWLRYETKWPQDRIRLCIEEVLDSTSEALGFIPRRTKSRAPSEDGPVQRRAFGKAVGGAAIAFAAPQAQPRRLGVSDVVRFSRDYADILQQDQVMGGTRRVENLAVELGMRVQSALSTATVSSRVRDMLHRLASDAMAAAAFAAIDARAPQRSRTHLDKAMTLAGLSRDSQTLYRVWDHLMLASSMRENHSEAAASADVMKRSTAARRDPLFSSLGHMRNANALARLNQPTEALRALRLAEKNFARCGTAERSGWINFYTPAEFNALSSYVWVAVGQHGRAESCLHHTLSAIPQGMTRDRALFTAHLSLAQVRQGELELACATAREASALLPPDSGSRRTANVLAGGRDLLLASGSKAPEVVEWIEVSRQWT
ncbi:XRE family transcriptional regulator [Streptomyces sp. NBC_01304]|uniref:XRE family transcriptional regulator n=1 Tax=Streptomyces sp. NBC_01304 TaxID=2903818 RepID=UPI002E128449|nr:XRE family transcriptional regulator [Streptomyces sp. NBC_01304]